MSIAIIDVEHMKVKTPYVLYSIHNTQSPKCCRQWILQPLPLTFTRNGEHFTKQNAYILYKYCWSDSIVGWTSVYRYSNMNVIRQSIIMHIYTLKNALFYKKISFVMQICMDFISDFYSIEFSVWSQHLYKSTKSAYIQWTNGNCLIRRFPRFCIFYQQLIFYQQMLFEQIVVEFFSNLFSFKLFSSFLNSIEHHFSNKTDNWIGNFVIARTSIVNSSTDIYKFVRNNNEVVFFFFSKFICIL